MEVSSQPSHRIAAAVRSLLRAHGAAILALVPAAGCVPHDPRSIIDHALWVESTKGPFFDAEAPPCAPTSWFAEDLGGELSLQVDTAECAHLTVSQESVQQIWPGDLVHARLYHYDVGGAEIDDAVGVRWAIALDGEVIFDETVAAPGEGGLELGDWDADRRIPEGTRIDFVLSLIAPTARHSEPNLWNFIELSESRQ